MNCDRLLSKIEYLNKWCSNSRKQIISWLRGFSVPHLSISFFESFVLWVLIVFTSPPQLLQDPRPSLTHQVQLLLPIHTWMCGLPLNCDQHTRATCLKTSLCQKLASVANSAPASDGNPWPPGLSECFDLGWFELAWGLCTLSQPLQLRMCSCGLVSWGRYFLVFVQGFLFWSSVSIYFYYWDCLSLEIFLGLLEAFFLIFLLYAVIFKSLDSLMCKKIKIREENEEEKKGASNVNFLKATSARRGRTCSDRVNAATWSWPFCLCLFRQK